VAEEYDRVRPEYPAALVETACSIGSLAPGSRVVEVGCGSGKLTRVLADCGLSVVAVDPGGQLVEIARRRVGDAPVRFHVARFEDIELPARSFDAVFSAIAFHWIDPAVGWAKVASLLRPGGLLALITYVGGLRTEGIRAAWQEVLPEAETWTRTSRTPDEVFAGLEERRANISELWAWLEKHELAHPDAADLFEDVEISKFPVERQDSAAGVVDFYRTTSAYLKLDRPRQELFECRLRATLGNKTYRSTMFATLVTARVA
jgi:ubiquinone/menaquinone biosynthesis C-methylase UbiE